MITAQDVRDKVFEKAKFNNGYDMASVDEFLETIADEITAAQKESNIMKSKMKVLADKIKEYRESEEALNLALLSAQKLAVQIETDARTRAAAMIAEAQAVVDEKLGSIEAQAVEQEQRLANAEASMRKFCEDMRAACQQQIRSIEDIASGVPAEDEAEEAAPVDAPAEEAVSIDDIFDDIKLASAKEDGSRSFSF